MNRFVTVNSANPALVVSVWLACFTLPSFGADFETSHAAKSSTSSAGEHFLFKQWETSLSPGYTAHDIQQTSDGGFILGGNEAPALSPFGFRVVRLNERGEVIWNRGYGESMADKLGTLQQTTDGGYILGATSARRDFWVVKLDRNGIVTWDRRFGGVGPPWDEELDSIQQTSDGGYIIAGSSGLQSGGNKTSPQLW